uniref:Uncharacterized protein n=1 Tax=Anguilla anguilla TaxID=7936 RepID=A0A0E9PBH3_ANGAN
MFLSTIYNMNHVFFAKGLIKKNTRHTSAAHRQYMEK